MARKRKWKTRHDETEFKRFVKRYGRNFIVAEAKTIPLPRKSGRPKGSLNKDNAHPPESEPMLMWLADWLETRADEYRQADLRSPIKRAYTDFYYITHGMLHAHEFPLDFPEQLLDPEEEGRAAPRKPNIGDGQKPPPDLESARKTLKKKHHWGRKLWVEQAQRLQAAQQRQHNPPWLTRWLKARKKGGIYSRI